MSLTMGFPFTFLHYLWPHWWCDVVWCRKRLYTLLMYLNLLNDAEPGFLKHSCASSERLLCKP